MTLTLTVSPPSLANPIPGLHPNPASDPNPKRIPLPPPLTRCAAAIWLALKTRGEQPWSAALEQHSGYAEAELQPCVRELQALHGKAASSGLQAVYKKYAQEACRNVSAIEPLCAAQLDPVPPAKAPPPVVALRENLYSAPLAGAAAPRTTRHGPKSAARRWAGADIVVVD